MDKSLIDYLEKRRKNIIEKMVETNACISKGYKLDPIEQTYNARYTILNLPHGYKGEIGNIFLGASNNNLSYSASCIVLDDDGYPIQPFKYFLYPLSIENVFEYECTKERIAEALDYFDDLLNLLE